MFRIENLTKSYRISKRRHYVFRDVNLEIPEGANIGIIGPNGAGKSTLLRIMGGIDYPDSGRIYTNHSISWPLGLKGGFVGHISGRDNCRMVCNLYNLSRHDMREKLGQIRELSGIGDYFEEPVKYYSSGMNSRLGFALSMAFDFDYFLIDEITAVGDAEFKSLAKEALREKAKQSKVIMVSHNMSDIRNFCDVGIFVKNGHLQLYENLDDAIDAYLPKSEFDPIAQSMLQKKHGLDAIKISEVDQEVAESMRQAVVHLESIQSKVKQAPVRTAMDEDDFYFQLGELYETTYQAHKAMGAYDKAIEHNALRPEFYVKLAKVSAEAGNPLGVHRAIRELLKLDPNNPRANTLLAKRYLEDGDYDHALECQLKVVRVLPSFGHGWFQLGQIYYELEQLVDATDAYIKAIELRPEAKAYYRKLTEVLFKQDILTDAMRVRLQEVLATGDLNQQKRFIKNLLHNAEVLDDSLVSHESES